MNDDLIALAVTFSALAVVVPLALVHGTHKAQEVQEAWRRLADRYRLRFEPGLRVVQNTKVTGSLAGRSFLLQKAGSGNQAAFHMELALSGSLPAGLSMKPTGKHLAAHLEVLGEPESQVVERTGEVRDQRRDQRQSERLRRDLRLI